MVCKLIVPVLLAFCLVSQATSNEVNPMFISLGRVDGKTYFYNDESYNWEGAKSYCDNQGLQLATITSEAQLSFLRSKNVTDFYSYAYWLGARDAKSPMQFAWEDGTNSTLAVGDYGQYWSYQVDPQTCLLFNVRYNGFATQLCSLPYWRPLCQSY